MKIVNKIRGEKWFRIYKIFNNKNLSREFVLNLVKSMPVNEYDPAMTYCLHKSSPFREDKEILWECARIEGKYALDYVLKNAESLGMDFVYEFIEKTHGPPGETPKYVNYNVIKTLNRYHFDNKELRALIYSYYEICFLALKTVINLYTKKRAVDLDHLMDTFERFKSPTRKRFLGGERDKKFPGIVESIMILEKESRTPLPELLSYFLAIDESAYSAVVHHYPEREDLLKKTSRVIDHHIFYRTKMTMSEKTLALVTKHVDLMYPTPLPFGAVFYKARGNVNVQTLINFNPMSFLRRYISDIDAVVGNLVPVPTPKACTLCGEDFDDEEIPHRFGEHHVECDYILVACYDDW